MTETQRAKRVQHAYFYLQDGSSIFMVENTTLYKLHGTLLRNASATLQGMFTMPRAEGQVEEGLTDDAPINLPLPVTVTKLDHLLRWLYRGWFTCESLTFVRSELEDILEMASYLMMDAGRAFAIVALHEERLSPVARLVLGQRHRIEEWIPQAVRALVAASDLTLDECTELGMRNFRQLNQTRAQIQRFRLMVAFKCPPIQHDSFACLFPSDCSAAWEEAWWNGFARQYLHPEDPLTPAEAVTKLENAFIPDVATECQLRTLAFVVNKGVFNREEEFIQGAITRLHP